MPEYSAAGTSAEPATKGRSESVAFRLEGGPRPAAFHPATVVLQYQQAALQSLIDTHRTDARNGLPISMRGRARLVELALELLAYAVATTEAKCRNIVAAAEDKAAAILDKTHAEVDQLLAWVEVGQEIPASGPVPPFQGWHPRPEPDLPGPIAPAGSMLDSEGAEPDAAERPDPPMPVLADPGFKPGYRGGAKPGYPGTNPRHPGTNPGYPGTNPGYPGTNPGYPGTNPGYPGADRPDGLPEGDPSGFFETPIEADDDAWRFMDDDLVGVGSTLLKLVRRRPTPRPPIDD